MSTTIRIAPVTRIEGHGEIIITLDERGMVDHARLLVRDFRAFEQFCVGRPYWEMPVITTRICGICPVSHALASVAACENILQITPPPAALLQRTLLAHAQLILSHSLSFFHLSGPDIFLGLDVDPAERNIVGMARRFPELVKQGIRLRQIAQETVNLVGGGHLHPEWVVPGGMQQPLSAQARDTLFLITQEARILIANAHDRWHERRNRFLAELGALDDRPRLFLGSVMVGGSLAYTAGRLRFTDDRGKIVEEVSGDHYGDVIVEATPDDTYMKPTCYHSTQQPLCVGPLARLHTGPFWSAPRAEDLRQEFLTQSPYSATSCSCHEARLIEMAYAAEHIEALLDDPLLMDYDVLTRGAVTAAEGVGVVEAPRGTLIHHYQVDRHGLLIRVNLIVATAHNSSAMDQLITAIARRHLTGQILTDGLLNRVEHGIRLYDPCLSCATHATGRMGIGVRLVGWDGTLLDYRAV